MPLERKKSLPKASGRIKEGSSLILLSGAKTVMENIIFKPNPKVFKMEFFPRVKIHTCYLTPHLVSRKLTQLEFLQTQGVPEGAGSLALVDVTARQA